MIVVNSNWPDVPLGHGSAGKTSELERAVARQLWVARVQEWNDVCQRKVF